MSAYDLWIRDILTIYGSLLFGTVLIYYIIKLNWYKLTSYSYRLHLLGFETECAELTIPYKKRLFGSFNNIRSYDENLRSKNCFRVLEIGVKTGHNIQFYPVGSHLICVDSNHILDKYLLHSRLSWQFSHVIIEKFIISDGSDLKKIPSNYVDVVVTTRSLCSTSSTLMALKEIKRILVPDGRYYFLEHIPHQPGTLTRMLQNLLTKLRIWPTFFGDCRLDSNPLEDIKSVGFSRIKWDTFKLRGYVSQPYRLNLTCHHIMGVAKK